MNCSVRCSFGEIVDKYSILKLKETKTIDIQKLTNIKNEMTAIREDVPQISNNDPLFEKLYNINSQLWNYEDLIREKSKNKEYDNFYIQYAEAIHTHNDERYSIKKNINEKYNSFLKEEKIYKEPELKKEQDDFNILEKGKDLYTKGDYKKSLTIIQNLKLSLLLSINELKQ